ncbi:Ras-related GTP-binding protein A [Hondaea fermentalgiana]|uniref:Ras-related GTP-binding protein A n=1 Tax=Hondaea fermentalgiana TaxID=2315210 RepID=A0A2R5GMI5_9STRA|nr:Ras-related GTP-binding protein A [Hondaea fermentalgiana]|eukprot:GBG30948.1 Ras-related GTP-binding protein A [Hondaea fermentalgiana]
MKQKVLLMGSSGSGKTSMRSIIFANYLARDTMRLSMTLDVEHSHVRFLGNLVLNLWDCGGQDAFYESYFESQRDHIFSNVAVLIYVFDIESLHPEKDIDYYRGCLEAITQNSDNANIFVLIHKMDRIPDPVTRREAFKQYEQTILGHSQGMKVRCFATSIWDETLYRAWSAIVYSLIPDMEILESNLSKLCEVLDADEVVLFEHATFLVISHATRKLHRDMHRFEKISNIIKQFKLSCGKSMAQFQAMDVRNSNFTAFIDTFTPNTSIMVIVSDPDIQPAIVHHNLKRAKIQFEQVLRL